MNFNNIDDLKTHGFTGFRTVRDLWMDSTDIPDARGVYLVLTPTPESPSFNNEGVGGFFKDKDPNVPIDILHDNWVTGSQVLYIGKAGSPTGQSTLKKRIKQCLDFGRIQKVGHWGGRYIWQLKNHQDLIFCWLTTGEQDPGEVKKQIISAFVEQYGRRPFANLQG